MTTGQTVSQDEIDAILQGIGSLAGDDLPVQAATQPFDWQQLDQVPRSKLPGLDVVNARFARAMRDRLRLWWGSDVQLQVQALRQVPFTVAFSGLPGTSHCASVQLTAATVAAAGTVTTTTRRASPQPPQAVLVADAALVFAAVDLALGGSAQIQAFNLTQAASPTTQRLVGHLMQVLAQASCAAWSGWLGVDARLEGVAPLKQPLHVATDSERMVVSSFQIQVGDHSGEVEVWHAWSALEPWAARLANPTAGDFVYHDRQSAAGWSHRLAARLQDVPVPLAARWASRPFNLAQLAALGIGDVIDLQGLPALGAGGQEVTLINGRLVAEQGQTALQMERWS